MCLLSLFAEGKISTLTRRLKAGADPNVAEGGESLLYCAIDKEKWSLVELLLSCGASPDLLSSAPPLVPAASKGRCDIVKKLLDAGANVDAKDEEGATALIDASAKGHADVVAMLLEAGAKPKVKDIHSKTATLYAAENKHAAVLELLLPLASKSDQQVARKVLSAKATLGDPEDIQGMLRAARVGTLPLVREFLNDGVPVDACDDEMTTALMRAANAGSLRVVKLLVERGADVNWTNLHGEGPLTYAALGGYAEVFDFLAPLTKNKKLLKRGERIIVIKLGQGTWKLPELWD